MALLWSATEPLRGEVHPTALFGLLYKLVYLKATDPSQWQSVLGRGIGEADLHLPGHRREPLVGADFGLVRDEKFRHVLRFIDEIDMSDGVGPESTAARLADDFLAKGDNRVGRGGAHHTPPAVADLLVRILSSTTSDSVLDPSCGSGELLCAAGRGKALVHGQVANVWSAQMATMNTALHGVSAEIQVGDALTSGCFAQHRFDTVLSNPPFAMRLPSDLTLNLPFGQSANADLAWLQLAVLKLNPLGTAAVVMPAGAAFRGNKETSIRAAMVEAGVVHAVIELPSQLFKHTQISTMLWILRSREAAVPRSDVLLINAAQLGTRVSNSEQILAPQAQARIATEYERWREAAAFKGESGFSHSATFEEVKREDFVLHPARYTVIESAKPGPEDFAKSLATLRAELAGVLREARRTDADLEEGLSRLGRQQREDGSFASLGDICSVVAGPGSLSPDGRAADGRPLILTRNIRNERVDFGEVGAVSTSVAATMGKFAASVGDIVAARVGSDRRFGLVGEGQRGWLVGPGCILLRAREKVLPAFLLHYLTGPDAQRWLDTQKRGTAIHHITTSALKALPVWLPTLSVQQEVIETMAPFRAAALAHNRVGEIVGELKALVLPALLADLPE
ncbi:N-6 DNA methylase [Actinokineospora pegani]|uniref:N-6 DNA methylase n=1 Tax=Actinokineospora pegani TaxID=2654637 RepID=UPI0012E99A7A|nr:N-6 DNA methylase [Actinokineospora pegani]